MWCCTDYGIYVVQKLQNSARQQAHDSDSSAFFSNVFLSFRVFLQIDLRRTEIRATASNRRILVFSMGLPHRKPLRELDITSIGGEEGKEKKENRGSMRATGWKIKTNASARFSLSSPFSWYCFTPPWRQPLTAANQGIYLPRHAAGYEPVIEYRIPSMSPGVTREDMDASLLAKAPVDTCPPPPDRI